MTGAWTDPSLPLEQRVRAFVEDLDAAELIAIALGDFTALSQRGLPTPRYVDAGSGLRDVPGATAFPTGNSLAVLNVNRAVEPELLASIAKAISATVWHSVVLP